MQLDLHYTDELLVSLYDIENSGRQDVEFYLALTAELGARSVIDLGCGTGVLACDLAAAGAMTTGVDPARAMLEYARTRPGGERVDWVCGDASALAPESADLVVMTGHVAQVFLDDDDWDAALRNCLRALRPGGHLAFETRNPEPAGWNRWNRDSTFGEYPLPDGASFQSWVDVTGVRPGLVDFEGHNIISGPGDLSDPPRELTATSTLRFRTRSEVQESLSRAGFEVGALYGDWSRGPVHPASPELIFVAGRP